jgi:hypothetical protein
LLDALANGTFSEELGFVEGRDWAPERQWHPHDPRVRELYDKFTSTESGLHATRQCLQRTSLFMAGRYG